MAVDRGRTILAGLTWAVMVGTLLGIGLFVATSFVDRGDERYTGPCRAERPAGFDPWSGSPRGAVLDCIESTDPVSGDVPDALAGRRAIPIPVGFALGAAGTAAILVWLGLRDRRGVGEP